ncbi:aminotransferase-like domain-containing protein [Nocardia jejuensis]|uniref:aminotransferase-like domain-containing protein n=1 Tax=Nocardia jejuensis TaxID=328049 RepID=UPI000830E517|nr:PLP-dependent aminotransferase family protein [Nocardia jejuensis]
MTDTLTTGFDSATLLSRLGAHESPLGGFGPPPSGVAADAIRLLGGVPADEALPTRQLRAAYDATLSDPAISVAALQYSSAPGIEPLRSWIAGHEGTDPDRVLVTNGALHGLSLLFSAILDPGDTVLVESPTFPLALRLLGHYGAQVVSVSVTEQGLDLDALEDRLRAGLRPKLFYLIPDFQNPTGSTLPAADRARVVALAEQYGFLVVSDNPYRDLRFAGEGVADASLESEVVVRVNTFSKTLGPGLRLGWLAGPRRLIPALTRLRGNNDQHSSLLTQTAIARLLTTPGEFDGILTAAHEIYRERSRALTTELRASVGDVLEFSDPEGGIFLWATASDPELDLSAVQARARALGTDFSLGRYFDPDGAVHHTQNLRLGFSNNSPERLRTAAQRLAEAFHAH